MEATLFIIGLNYDIYQNEDDDEFHSLDGNDSSDIYIDFGMVMCVYMGI